MHAYIHVIYLFHESSSLLGMVCVCVCVYIWKAFMSWDDQTKQDIESGNGTSGPVFDTHDSLDFMV